MRELDWGEEDARLLYLADTADWIALSWPARGMYLLLLRVVDRAGTLSCGRHGWAGVSAVLRTSDTFSMESAIRELHADGWIIIDGPLDHPTLLEIPEFQEAQEPNQLRARVPNKLRRAVFERDGHTCRYCLSKLGISIDHVMPGSRGGTNTLDNLLTACRSCNARKKDRTPAEAGMAVLPAPERSVA